MTVAHERHIVCQRFCQEVCHCDFDQLDIMITNSLMKKVESKIEWCLLQCVHWTKHHSLSAKCFLLLVYPLLDTAHKLSLPILG